MLTTKQKRYLKALGTHLKPIVQIGKAGVTPSVIDSATEAIAAHELIKVRAIQNCPEEPATIFAVLGQATAAEVVQVIGRNALLYKPNLETPKLLIP